MSPSAASTLFFWFLKTIYLCRSTSCWPGTMEPTSCWYPARSLWLQVSICGLVPACQRCSFAWHVPSGMLGPSANRAAGRAHWELLLRARAVESQSFVIAAAQAGKHNEKRESYGHSIIIDPWGDVIGKLEDPLATGIAVAELDMTRLDEIRKRMPIEKHRRQGRSCLGLQDTM